MGAAPETLRTVKEREETLALTGRQRRFGWVIVVAAAVGLGVQAVRPSLGRPGGAQVEVAAPLQVREILQRRCYACHSDESRLEWWDQVAPMYWVVASDVQRARARLNFSELGTRPAVQRAELFESVNQVQMGAMPLEIYLLGHPGSGVTAEELTVLKAYLAPFAAGAGKVAAAGKPSVVGNSVEGVRGRLSEPAGPSPNGVPFLAGFADWRVISTTDRGDNHTLRIITGNDIAMRAIAARQLPSWPEGAAFAKIAWQAVDDGHGHVSPGKFVQVEFMEKNRVMYAGTGGWGFARFVGPDLKPYGKDAHFDNECLGCHAPVRDNDYVFTLPLPRGLGAGQ